jgi:prepilin-type N-terminal cleavage/methylation domain-containing protein
MITPSRRLGMSLVELLIVIAIIGVLIQLTLPAVESAREASRRLACQNNLHQLGLAAQQHDQALGHLPTAGWGWAWIGDPDRGTGKSQPGSWAYQLLPFLDEKNTHDIGSGLEGEDKVDALTRLAGTTMSLLYCPHRQARQLKEKAFRSFTLRTI